MSSKPLVETTVPQDDPLNRAVSTPSWQRNARRVLTLLFLLSLFLPAIIYHEDIPENGYSRNLFTRYMALALFALSIDLVWGYTGLLSLGQGVFFGLGGYAIGYSLILQGTEQRGLGMMPDYMRQCRMEAIPGWIASLHDTWTGLLVALTLPAIVAFILGAVMFQRKIKGVYFSLFTQAVLMAFFTLINNQRRYTGGVDGLTYLASFNLFGYTFPTSSSELYYIVTGTLVFFFIALWILLEGKFGKVLTAIRDNEFRVMALGYNTAMYKTFAYTLAGFIAGVAGALYTTANGSAGPSFFGIGFSIEVVIFVAVGGRGTLVGAVLGTLIVSMLKTYLNDNSTAFSATLMATYDATARFCVDGLSKIGLSDGSMQPFSEPAKLWPIWLGGLFVVVVLFMPDGILGLLNKITARILHSASSDGNLHASP